MSVRKIAEATGVGKSTVQRVIESGVPFGTPDGMPKLVTGADGKQYPAKQKREPLPVKPVPATPEQASYLRGKAPCNRRPRIILIRG